MAKLHIVSILDRSGSMGGSESEVIGAYNGFVEDQKKIVEDANIDATTTLVLFDHEVKTVYKKTPINDTPTLTSDVYNVRGMTALYDAIGKTIAEFEGKKKVIFFIETDGMENGSSEFSADTVKALVQKKTAEGWDFNFVGADLSQATTQFMSQTVGITKAMSSTKTYDGYATRNLSFASATMAYVGTTTDASE